MIDTDNFNINELPTLALSERSAFPNCVAVYLVLSNTRDVLYIGRTTSLVIRWRQHHLKDRLKVLGGVSIAWIECSVNESIVIERQLIEKYQPRFNAQRKKASRPKQKVVVMFRVRPNIPSDAKLARQLRIASDLTGISMSRFLREAMIERLAVLSREFPEIEAA